VLGLLGIKQKASPRMVEIKKKGVEKKGREESHPKRSLSTAIGE